MRVGDRQVEEALRACHGLYTRAAAAAGCSARTIQRRVEGSERLRGVLAEIRDSVLDTAEDALYRAVARGEAWAVCFYLKCKGKGRGYVERQEVAAVAAAPVDVPETELDRIISEHQAGENGEGEAAGGA